MKKNYNFIGILFLFIFGLQARESIKSYSSHIIMNRDGSLDITEKITVHAEGKSIKKGIYRDFPTIYRGRNLFFSVIVPFDVSQVLLNGTVIPFDCERIIGGKRVIMDSPSGYLSSFSNNTFTIQYTTGRQIGFFNDHDELFFNAVGDGWEFPIERVKVTIVLPPGLAAEECKKIAYVGKLGSRGSDYKVSIVNDNTMQFVATRTLHEEAFTFALAFKKGVIVPPTFTQKMQWFWKDNAELFLSLLFCLVLLIFLIFSYLKMREDKPPTNVIPLFSAPEGFTPGMVSYFTKRKVVPDTLSSDIVAMAVEGLIEIELKKKGFLFTSSYYRFTRTDKKCSNQYYQKELDSLFSLGKVSSITIGEKNRQFTTSPVEKMMRKATEMYSQRVKKSFFYNLNTVYGVSFFLFVGFVILGFFGNHFFDLPLNPSVKIIKVGFFSLSLFVIRYLFKGYTTDGYAIKDQIDGFKLYLKTAERERLKFVSTPPEMTPQHYETMLPYAMALGVEDAWTKNFTPIFKELEKAGKPYSPSWYRGSKRIYIASFSKSFGTHIKSSLSSSIGASAPGTRSGFGSGGGAGRGGGGGGGGGR